MRHGCGALVFPLTLLLAPAALADSGLFAVADQNPLIRGAYLPLPEMSGAPESGWGFSAGLQWSNTVNIERTATEQLWVDEETAELDLRLSRTIDGWRVRALLPVLHRDGGILDGPINDWHALLGLPRGERPLVPTDAYRIAYANAAGQSLNASRGTALGNTALELGRELATGRTHLALFGGLELPTGSRAHLSGDQAVNAALWLEGGTALSAHFSLDARAGMSRTGGALPLPENRSLSFGTLAVSWQVSPHFAATAQLDGHTRAVAGSDLTFLSHAVVGTFGGHIRLDSGGWFDFALSEDVEVDHSPDVSFHFGWRHPLGGR